MKPSEVIANANKDIYERDYERIVMKGGLLNRWVYRKTHQELERFDIKSSQRDIHILELGAQSDQHRAWVKNNYHRYVVSDINFEPLKNARLKHEIMLSELESNLVVMFPLISFEEINAEQIGYQIIHLIA